MRVLIKMSSNNDISLTYPSFISNLILPHGWIYGTINAAPDIYKHFVMTEEIFTGLQYYGVPNHKTLRQNPFTGEYPTPPAEKIEIDYTFSELTLQLNAVKWFVTTITEEKKNQVLYDYELGHFKSKKASDFYNTYYDEAVDILANNTTPSTKMNDWNITRHDGNLLNLCEDIVLKVDIANNKKAEIVTKYDTAISKATSETSYVALEAFLNRDFNNIY